MSAINKKINYFETPEGIELKAELERMHASEQYKTVGSYSPKADDYEGNLVPFVKKHMSYIQSHPQLNPSQYIANLQISTKIR